MNENMIPEPIVLDDKKPSPEQLREAYELALRLWALAPWDMPMGENQLLAVEHADGRKYALFVMGEYGEHRAVLGESLKCVLSNLCRTVLKGTTFLPNSECDAVREIYEFTAQRMGF